MTYDLHFYAVGNQKVHIQFCKDGEEREKIKCLVFLMAELYSLKLFRSTCGTFIILKKS